jgi:hypothetical protein
VTADDQPRRPVARRILDALPKALAPVVLLLVGSVATYEVPKLLAGRTIQLDPPVGLKLELGTFLEEYYGQKAGVPTLGVEFQSNVKTTGYDGVNLTVICTVSDQRTGQSDTAPKAHTFPGGSAPRTTQPCWLPLPGPPRDKYTVQVAITQPGGGGNLAEAYATIP